MNPSTIDLLPIEDKRVFIRVDFNVPLTAKGEVIADLIIAKKIKRVPVLSEDKLVGIVTRRDIIRAIAMGKHIAMHTPIYDL
jgi:CBS domain-containing protein